MQEGQGRLRWKWRPRRLLSSRVERSPSRGWGWPWCSLFPGFTFSLLVLVVMALILSPVSSKESYSERGHVPDHSTRSTQAPGSHHEPSHSSTTSTRAWTRPSSSNVPRVGSGSGSDSTSSWTSKDRPEEFGSQPKYLSDRPSTTDIDIEKPSTTSNHGERQSGEQGEKFLLRSLMKNYEPDVRPVRNASAPVLIQVGITLTQIFDMDEKNQVLTTNVWLDQEWNDELLRWDPADFDGLQTIRLPCRLIWLPDVLLYNSADDYERGYMPSRAMVSSDGNVFWPPPTKFRSTCPVDVTYFPFDDQICTLKLGSWTYNGYQVDITNRSAEVDLSNYVQNGEWELLEARLQRNVVYYSCCPEPFPDVTVTLVIRRKTLYYIYNIVLPCMMLSILTLLVFCLPPDSGEKVALGITVLLAFSVFMLAIAEKMPETSTSIPLIGIYLTAVMAITSISVIVTVVVLNLHYLGPRVQPIPSWLRAFLPKDDIDFLREKSLLLPYTAKFGNGNRRAQQVYLISQHRPNQPGGPVSYSTSVPPTPTIVNNNSATPRHDGSNDVLDQDTTQARLLANHNRHATVARLRRRALSQELGEPVDEELGATEDLINSSTDSVGDDEIDGAKQSESITTNGNGRETGGLHYRSRHRQPSMTSPHQVRPTHIVHHRSKGLAHLSPHRRLHRLNNLHPPAGKHYGNSHRALTTQTPPTNMSMRIQEELLKSIQHLLIKQEDLEFQNLLVAEWRLVAQVIDRILFWIFFVITIASSGVFLLILPLYKRTWNGPN